MYYGCAPDIAVPDNLKAAVIERPKNRPPRLNEAYVAFLVHYGMNAIPTRPNHPQDKSVVENSVKLIQRRMKFLMHNKPLQREEQLHLYLANAVEYWNNRKLKNGNGHSRRSLFEAEEHQYMNPLPTKAFVVFTLSKNRRVGKDYHVEFKKNFYSVPHFFKFHIAVVKIRTDIIDILIDGVSVAMHHREFGEGKRMTQAEHRPDNHRAEAETDLCKWADQFGPEAVTLAKIEVQKRRPSMATSKRIKWIKDMQRFHKKHRFIAACKRAVAAGDLRFDHVFNVLDRGLENSEISKVSDTMLTPKRNVRGSA
jgi:hypothetical protein